VEEHDVKDYDLAAKSKLIEEILHDKGKHTYVFYGSDQDILFSLSLKSIDAMKALHPTRGISYIDLDVSILHTLLLEKLLGIGEKQLANQENLEYTHSIEDGVQEVDEGRQEMTLFISPTSIRQIQEVSLANEKMPQKSTYFYPKLLTGLVFNKF
ncbi:MAG TPA: DUF1015 domain-containing protein, partial [Clostridia bacterium]|nr:DUF1015 domain-containing protein [Clostridia bacterium]